MSLVHAQDIVAKLLEAVIDAASPALRLAKLEGDAAFSICPAQRSSIPRSSKKAAAIHRAFHSRIAALRTNTLCNCDGCQQAGDLKIKLVGHVGEVAMQKVKQLTELAGVDVILVHRMLKNDDAAAEYLLVTGPVYETWDPPLQGGRRRSILSSTISAPPRPLRGSSPLQPRHCRRRARSRCWRGCRAT